jgi:energy-coupling factor transporter ATP-binding protein EcfA2
MSQLEDLLQQSTVKLSVPGQSGWGTGFFVAPGLILTCAHVVKKANGQPVQVRWQNQDWAEAVIEKSLPDPDDLALLRVTTVTGTHSCVYLDEAVQSRDPLYLFGYPDQDFPNGCPVTFDCEGLTGDQPALIKFALGQVRPGMSGSPLLNQRTGKVCGIVKFTRDRSTDLGGGAIPTGVILAQFPELRELQQQFHDNQRWVDFLPTSSSEQVPNRKVSWQQACRAMLEDRRHLTSNRLLSSEMQRDLTEDNIFVDLALVQQKKADKRSKDVLPEQGSELYEPSSYAETERFEFNRFLTDVLEAKKSEKLAVIGEPGAGKTTLLQRIAFWLLSDTEDLVIWVSLGELRDKDLRDYLTEDWLQEAMMYADSSIRADWEQQFKQRSVWLLLDGLDEMTADARDALCLRGWVTQARVIMTCRLNVWQANSRILQGFETYRMLEFQLPQMDLFIQKWFHNDLDLGQSLKQALNQIGKERIRDLARNPLRLTLLCSAWHLREGKLPDTKAELYKQFVDDLYEWKSDRFPTTASQRNQLNEKLGELAKEAIDKELTRFRLRHSLVCEILGEPDDPTSTLRLALDLGWLNAVGVDATNPRQPVYAFFHPTFQEYFAAKSINDWDFFLPRNHEDKPIEDLDKPETYKPYRIFEPQWKEVILLWLGQDKRELTEQKTAFIEALENFNDGCNRFYGYRAVFLAAAGIREFNQYPGAAQIVEKITFWSFGRFDEEQNRWITFINSLEQGARSSLAETDRQRAISKISSLLENCKDEGSQYKAADFLGSLDQTNNQAVVTLLNLLNSTEIEWLRLNSAGSLIRLDRSEPEIEATLLQVAKDSKSEEFRRDAAYFLRQINEEHSEAIATLLELFQKSKNEILRFNVYIDEIGKNNLSVLKVLLKIFLSQQDIVHRRQAGNYLVKIIASQFQLLEKLLELLRFRKALSNIFDKHQQQKNFSILRRIVTLLDLGLTAKDKKIRRQAIWELLQLGINYPEVITAFLEFYVAPIDDERKAIFKLAETLELDSSNIVSVGIELLNIAEDDWLRYSIACLLNRFDPENSEAVIAFSTLLDSCKHEITRRWIANQLKEINSIDLRATETFLMLLRNTQDWNSARWSAQSLGEICNDNLEITQKLLELLTTATERRVSTGAMYGLKKVFEPNALAMLVTELKGYLNGEIRKTKSSLYFDAFEVLWHCASRMPYVDFYTLWHSEETEKELQQS